ncbi:MAG: 30S ribosomal protein S6 [Verrucomicrobiaceae bacterium]|jgi:small subunit ribosomal protein S6|nr:30S ribosomal protein S6 [Verrucomicrobiaceae bacterium]
MKRQYEALIVLDTKGKEESVEQILGTVSKEMETAGLKLKQIDNMGKRKFPFNPRHVEAGTFINIQFEGEPAALDAARAKLKLNDNIYQQYYQKKVA